MSVNAKDDEFIEITQELFQSLEKVKDGHVVQSPYFNMLEGARALEVTNERLDTGLIPLSDADLSFNTAEAQSVSSVIGVMSQLLIAYMSWLDNSSLPVTVASCRYVQTFLENYQKNGGDLKKSTFLNDRLAGRESCEQTSFESQVVNKVLRSFVMGICKLVGFTLAVGLDVLYEEEDLTTRNMDFDFLTKVTPEIVINELNSSTIWLKSQTHEQQDEIDALIKFLQLARCLVQLPALFTIPINIFDEKAQDVVLDQTKFIGDAAHLSSQLKSFVTGRDLTVPVASFSRFVQLDCNNSTIPYELYILPTAEAYDNLTRCLTNVSDFVQRLANIENLGQLHHFLLHDVAYRIDASYGVLARGLFQLFFIRDDRSIVGSSTQNVSSLSMKYMENLTCLGSNIVQPDNWHGIQGSEQQISDTKNDVMDQLNRLLADVETCTHHLISTYANNRCRQRQLLTRAILTWDTLQANSENMEINLWTNHQIGDKLYNFNEYAKAFEEDEQDMPLSITSFIYYTKLKVMVEVALSGFELDLYKVFEGGQMYWYISYLLQLIVEHLTIRVKKINNSKAHYITSVLSKKLKKLKAGPKKQALKQTQQYYTTEVLPRLSAIEKYNETYLAPIHQAMYFLCDAIRMEFIVLDGLRLINGSGDPFANASTDHKSLYNLRMKPWSSVGVPELPTYEQYKNSISIEFLNKHRTQKDKITHLKQIIAVITNKISQAKDIYTSVSDLIRSDETIRQQVISEANAKFEDGRGAGSNLDSWYKSLVKTCIMHSVQMTSLSKLMSTPDFDPQNYRVSMEAGYHRYFPKIVISKK